MIRMTPWLGEEPQSEGELALCTYGKEDSPTQIVRHQDVQGRLFFGDINNFQSFYDNNWETIRSAKAEPEESSFVEKVRTDCHNKDTGQYYPCVRKMRVDYSGVSAVVRSNFGDPADMALKLCSRAARNAWQEQLGYAESNSSQKCRIVARAVCNLPPTQKPAAQE